MTAQSESQDVRFMQTALGLARRSLGRVWPNPAVGCVLTVPVTDSGPHRMIARGWTQPGGRPHAETQALQQAGSQARGATAYISLEPCAHQGETPPCSLALIEAGITRAVIACCDPDTRVAGQGLAMLRQAGIACVIDVEADDAQALNRGFFQRIDQGRPLVTLKMAASQDGRITDSRGSSQWISSDCARAWTHGLRARYDAVFIGSGVAVGDDPRLTCRLPGMAAYSPLRILLDSHLRTPPTARFFSEPAPFAPWLVTGDDVSAQRLTPYTQAGAEIIGCRRRSDHFLDLQAVMLELGRRGLTRILIEGGALATAFLEADLVDRVIWFSAPRLFGDQAQPSIASFCGDDLEGPGRFRRVAAWEIDSDICAVYVRRDHDRRARLDCLI